MTSLPFHQFHKQTYDAFANKSEVNGSASTMSNTAKTSTYKLVKNGQIEKDQLD